MTENSNVPEKPASPVEPTTINLADVLKDLSNAPSDPSPVEPTPQDLKRVPLPRYRSRTVVEAAKIVHVEESALILDPGDGRDQFVHPVSPEWIKGRAPGPGRTSLMPGYLVRYGDGYELWCPAAEFEAGYRAEVPEPAAATERVHRTIETHRVNPANVDLVIDVLDEPGAGGACHLYRISGFNTASNKSDPFQARYGKPSDHSTVLFQNGPVGEVGANGVTDEALLEILIDRLKSFQDGPLACDENANALWALQNARHWLHSRMKRRMAQGTEGADRGN